MEDVYVLVGGLGNDAGYLRDYARALQLFHATLVTRVTLEHERPELMAGHLDGVWDYLRLLSDTFNRVHVVAFSAACPFLLHQMASLPYAPWMAKLKMTCVDPPNLYQTFHGAPASSLKALGAHPSHMPVGPISSPPRSLQQDILCASPPSNWVQLFVWLCNRSQWLRLAVAIVNHRFGHRPPVCVGATILALPISTLRAFVSTHLLRWTAFPRTGNNFIIGVASTDDPRYRLHCELLGDASPTLLVRRVPNSDHHVLHKQPNRLMRV